MSAAKADCKYTLREVFHYADSRSLYADGEEILPGMFDRSAVAHLLDILSSADEKDELFDMKLIERAVKQYPLKLDDRSAEADVIPERTDAALPYETAYDEAGRLLDEMYELNIPLPAVTLIWVYTEPGTNNLRPCSPELANGLM